MTEKQENYQTTLKENLWIVLGCSKNSILREKVLESLSLQKVSFWHYPLASDMSELFIVDCSSQIVVVEELQNMRMGGRSIFL